MKINLTFDSFIYKLIVNNDEDITFVLPRVKPEKTKILKENIRSTATEVNIKYYIKTNDVIPNVIFAGQDNEVNIVTKGTFKLYANSLTVVTFNTIDGGLTWLITSFDSNDISEPQDTKAIITELSTVTNNIDKLQMSLNNIENNTNQILSKLTVMNTHIKNTENAVFWIDSETIQPTRETVDPDTLAPLD